MGSCERRKVMMFFTIVFGTGLLFAGNVIAGNGIYAI
jgi:hypothetical protein